MSSIITTNFSTRMAQDFINMMDVSSNSYLPIDKRSYLFVTLGKQIAWPNEQTPPTPAQSTKDFIAYSDQAIVARRLSLDNVSFVVPRHNWVSGTTYSRYDSNTSPLGTAFYVLNSKDQVFKCLDNNNNAASTDEPQLFLSTTSLEEPYFVTSDGYKWKYMYTLSSNEKQKFLNSDWMPVKADRFVRAAAVNRGIDIIRITNSGNNYVDGPTQDIIKVVGDGRDAVLKANVINGHISDIVIQNRGQDYTRANLIFTDITGGVGTGASADVVLSPQNGHGYDPVEELCANTVIFNIDFVESEDGIFPAENEYRQITLLLNPYVYDTQTLATGPLYKLYSKILVSPGVGDYNNDEKVIQGSSIADATFSAEVISFDEATNTLFLNNLNGTFAPNQPLKGTTSGAIRVGLNKTPPTLQPYSGKTLFAANKVSVTRDPDQTDRIRFILSF